MKVLVFLLINGLLRAICFSKLTPIFYEFIVNVLLRVTKVCLTRVRKLRGQRLASADDLRSYMLNVRLWVQQGATTEDSRAQLHFIPNFIRYTGFKSVGYSPVSPLLGAA